MKGVSIWFTFSESSEAYRKFDSVIRNLSRNYNSPAFVPHITLLSGIEDRDVEDILEDAEVIGENVKPFQAKVSEIDIKDSYYQCVFALLEESTALTNAHSLAKQLFERNDEPAYMPHVSLIYGDIEEETQEEIEEQSIPLVEGLHFTLDTIQVWRTEGRVEDWSLLTTIQLTGGD